MIHPPLSPTEHLAFNTARFGRIVSVDFRDRQYLLRPKLAARSTRTSRYWSPSTVLDQGNTPQCVSYAGEAFLKSGPVLNLQYKIPQNLYDQCQSVDEWAATPHDGTSVRALFKILQSHGYVTEYNWAFDIDTVVQFVFERGPVVFGTDWYDCVVPGTRVLTTDLYWKPAEKLQLGDSLIGFSEHAGRDSIYQPSCVLSNSLIVRPVFEVVTDRGSVTVSGGHLFVNSQYSGKSRRIWKRADALKPGDLLCFFGKPWETDTSWEAGWLAGFYDGEGSLAASNLKRSSGLITCAQNPGPTLDYALALLTAKGFDYGMRINKQTGCRCWYLRHNQAKARFLGSVRPQRLLLKSTEAWLGNRTWNNDAPNAVVQEVKPLGNHEVVAIGTSTKTLLTDGFLSHNSMFDVVSRDFIQIADNAQVVGGHAYLICGVNTIMGCPDGSTGALRMQNSWSADWGDYGQAWMSLRDATTLLKDWGEAATSAELFSLGDK
jgi:hypothetical protein